MNKLPSLHILTLDVPHDQRREFKQLTLGQHLPRLRGLPGVGAAEYYCRGVDDAEPRHAIMAEVDRAEVEREPEWMAADAIDSWPIRPLRSVSALYAPIGRSKLAFATPYMFTLMLDVEPQNEVAMNEVYDSEHIPALLQVEGLMNAARFLTRHVSLPRYLTVYEISDPVVLRTASWEAAASVGRWRSDIAPYTFNKHRAVYTRIGAGDCGEP